MSNVSKTGGADATTRANQGPAEADERRGGDGEFDRVLENKAGQPHRRQGRDGRGQEEGGFGGGRDQSDEAMRWRALPGDVMIARPIAAPAEAGAPEALTGAERVAEIQRIADQIVQAVDIRLGTTGAAEVRLELNLGRLGSLGVDLQRSAEGEIRVGFDAATVEASNLLREHAGELASKLEARGVALRELTVRSTDQATFRLETGGPDAPRPAEPVRAAASSGEAQAQGQRQPFDQERERRQPRSEIPESDEE